MINYGHRFRYPFTQLYHGDSERFIVIIEWLRSLNKIMFVINDNGNVMWVYDSNLDFFCKDEEVIQLMIP